MFLHHSGVRLGENGRCFVPDGSAHVRGDVWGEVIGLMSMATAIRHSQSPHSITSSAIKIVRPRQDLDQVPTPPNQKPRVIPRPSVEEKEAMRRTTSWVRVTPPLWCLIKGKWSVFCLPQRRTMPMRGSPGDRDPTFTIATPPRQSPSALSTRTAARSSCGFRPC